MRPPRLWATDVFPTPYTVAVIPRIEGAPDAMGQPTVTWGEPVPQSVYGWAPAGTSEPFEAAREPITWELDLFAPPGFTCGPHDRIMIPGDLEPFEVEGRIQDFTYGPFEFKPGVRVRLKRVDG